MYLFLFCFIFLSPNSTPGSESREGYHDRVNMLRHTHTHRSISGTAFLPKPTEQTSVVSTNEAFILTQFLLGYLPLPTASSSGRQSDRNYLICPRKETLARPNRWSCSGNLTLKLPSDRGTCMAGAASLQWQHPEETVISATRMSRDALIYF